MPDPELLVSSIALVSVWACILQGGVGSLVVEACSLSPLMSEYKDTVVPPCVDLQSKEGYGISSSEWRSSHHSSIVRPAVASAPDDSMSDTSN